MTLPRRLSIAAGLFVALSLPAAARADCMGRPTDPGGAAGYSYDTAASVSSYATARAKVFYATSGPNAASLATTRADGVPDGVGLAGDIAEDALVRYEQMGFQKPVPDTCPSNGGDGRLDIYLVKFANADGTAVVESCTGHACSTWLLCDATFVGRGYASVTEGFRTVIPHEVFHAVQNAYDGVSIDRFWAEGTAQWAMKTLHPELMDLERHLGAFFSVSGRSIDVPPMGLDYLYGTAVWPVFLTERYDATLVRSVLEQEVSGTGSLAAVDAALAPHSSSLAAEFPLFVAWNACTKDRVGTGGYASAGTYPSINPPQELSVTAQAITTGFSNFTYHLAASAPSHVTIDTDRTRNGALLVPLEAGKCRLDQVATLPANVQSEALVVVSGVTAKKTDAPFTLMVVAGLVAEGMGSGGPGAGGGGSSGCAVGIARGPLEAHSMIAALIGAALALGRRRSSRRLLRWAGRENFRSPPLRTTPRGRKTLPMTGASKASAQRQTDERARGGQP